MIRPRVIQGGMGVGVSNWRLARAVSRLGQLGVVSGTALDQVLARRLQDGDPGGHMRRALAAFPLPALASEVWASHYRPNGRTAGEPYVTLPMPTPDGPRTTVALTIVANFVEVTLARHGHGRPVGINYLEKIRLPHLPALYGAMLAGVDVVLMGAGIPTRIPGVIDALSRHEPVEYPLRVAGAGGDTPDVMLAFDPRAFVPGARDPLRRPSFVPIVSSDVLARTLVRRANGRIDGFVVEGPTAGGHNAPPRGEARVNARGEPLYGERDAVDLEAMRTLGLPFWLAGGYGSPERLSEALAEGAAGVQVGTAFALCRQSGLRREYRDTILETIARGQVDIITDGRASPTGFPFKVVSLPGTLSDPAVYARRPRICDLGYLREAFRTPDGRVDFRCPAEPLSIWQSKGGGPADAIDRKCLCNALVAAIGHPQVRAGRLVEPPVITAGDDLAGVRRFLPPGQSGYSAADVIRTLLGGHRPGRPPNHRECA